MLRKTILMAIILSMSAVAFAIGADPLETGIGARPLGIGKAFVGMPPAAEHLFLNPSGLSGIKNLNIISMSGKHMQDVSFTTIGASNPFDFGTLGIGYVSSGVENIPLTRKVGSTIEVYGSTGYSNKVYLASYALPFHQIAFLPKFGFIKDTSLGTTFKYYVQEYSNLGGVMKGAAGSGFDIDLAVSYRPGTLFSLGAVLQNALPASMGGKFTWENKTEEGIPAVLKIGGLVNIQNLKLALDSDMYIKEKKPGVWHAGLEWWPLEVVAFRFGLDQQSSVVRVDNNLTYGFGLKYKGVTFDYAYHQYGDISENSSHYFSLGYVGFEPAAPSRPPALPSPPVIVTFRDVPVGYWAKGAIEYLAGRGVISGYPDGTFRPDKTLSRAELCTLLVKARKIPVKTPEKVFFPDLPIAHWAAPYVHAAVDLKLVEGYPDSSFNPKKPFTRAEAVKILAVFDGLKMLKTAEKPFPDMPITHWAANYVQAAKKAGFLNYLNAKDFEPDRELTRAEAAEMLYRTASFRR